MSSTAAAPLSDAEATNVLTKMSSMWWLWLITGIAWVIISLVILQFDESSVNTIGILVGFMFLATGVQQLVLSGFSHGGLRVFWAIFGVLFIIGGIVAIASPAATFTAIADILGFLFLLVGVFWLIDAFATKGANEFWWLGLISGILMVLLAFWTSAADLLAEGMDVAGVRRNLGTPARDHRHCPGVHGAIAEKRLGQTRDLRRSPYQPFGIPPVHRHELSLCFRQ